MSVIGLTGRLIGTSRDEVAIVKRFLPRHVELTRAEPGCLHFEVVQTEDLLVWSVAERLAGQPAFEAQQKRVKASDWGRATAGIRRDYVLSQDVR